MDRTMKDVYKGSSRYSIKMDGKDQVQTYRKKQGTEKFLQFLVGRKRGVGKPAPLLERGAGVQEEVQPLRDFSLSNSIFSPVQQVNEGPY